MYTADDKNDGCLYKFIASKAHTLETGRLYVADLDRGKWIPLDWNTQPTLQKHFNHQTDVLAYARKAAALLGGTALDRPEDIDIHPLT